MASGAIEVLPCALIFYKQPSIHLHARQCHHLADRAVTVSACWIVVFDFPIALMLPSQKSHLAFLPPAYVILWNHFTVAKVFWKKIFVIVVTSRTTVLKIEHSPQSHWVLLTKHGHPGHSLLLLLSQPSLCWPPRHCFFPCLPWGCV